MEMASSDYLSQSLAGKFEPPPAPPMFNPFHSPPVDAQHLGPSSHVERKRKRTLPDHSTTDLLHGGFDSPNSPTQSNPDLDSYIKARRKPREKKACQVCR